MASSSRLLAGLSAVGMLAARVASAEPAPSASPGATPDGAAEPAPAPVAPPSGGEVPPSAAETLETPYADVPPAPAAPAPPGRIVIPPLPVDSRPLEPIRATRKLALTGEIGWNGLSSFGPVLTYHIHPHVALDLGTGFSLFGWKVGVRGRYNLLKSNFTPFFGVGLNATSGLGEVPLADKNDPNYDPNREVVTINVKPSYLMQGVFGFDYIHRRGFTMLAAIGFSKLLNSNNVEVVAGDPNAEERLIVDVLFKSGPVISTSFGYAWE